MTASLPRRRSSPGAGAPLLATARAGNVIGGGDWARGPAGPRLRARRRPQARRSMSASPTRCGPGSTCSSPVAAICHLGSSASGRDDGRSPTPGISARPMTDARPSRGSSIVLATHWPGLRWQRASRQRRPTRRAALARQQQGARTQLGWRPRLVAANGAANDASHGTEAVWRRERRREPRAAGADIAAYAVCGKRPWPGHERSPPTSLRGLTGRARPARSRISAALLRRFFCADELAPACWQRRSPRSTRR